MSVARPQAGLIAAQVPEVWAASVDWGLHGDQQLCAGGHSRDNGADLW